MRKFLFGVIVAVSFISILLFQISCTQQTEKKQMTQEELIALGKYIVNTSGCNDCHTPKIMTDMGPMPDTTKILSGHQQDEMLPPLDVNALGMQWAATTMSLTAWVGPWGISYSANLTPNNATGLGAVTEEMFIKSLREGKIKGVGRPMLPPMPWQEYGKKTDEDLKAVYAYLHSLKPMQNMVPQPTTPDKVGEVLVKK
jgi:hypothetical protein